MSIGKMETCVIENLALYGGTPVRTKPLPNLNSKLGAEEEAEVLEVIRSKQLWQGPKLREFEKAFAEAFDMPYALAVNSGTAACHTALAAAGIQAGDEVILPAISDFGSVVGVLYEKAIPVFVDVDPRTLNLDPVKFEEAITSKTKCVMVVHVFGHPVDMDPVMEIAARHGLPVIEDCAQATGALYHDRVCGSIGDMACFSLMSWKHLNAGEGGVVLFKNKEQYEAAKQFATMRGGIESQREETRYRAHVSMGLNYRIGDLTLAVALAQLKKLPGILEGRIRTAESLAKKIEGIEGISTGYIAPWAKHAYWFYPFKLDLERLGVTIFEFARALDAEGIPLQIRNYYLMYDQPIFMSDGSREPDENRPWLLDENLKSRYYKGLCPQAEAAVLCTPGLLWNELFDEEVTGDMAEAIRKVANYYTQRKSS